MPDIVNVGSAPNAGNGDPLRDGFMKVNQRFRDLMDLMNPRGAWASGVTYALRDWVVQGGQAYIAAVTHTSGTFATDLAAGRWMNADAAQLVYDLGAFGSSKGSDLVNATQPWPSARTITQAAKNAQLVHIGDFSISLPGLPLQRAISETPVGGTLKLGAGPYVGNFAIARDDLTIVGEGKPVANGGRTALQGGTIIRGTLQLNGSNLALCGFGIDSGVNACTDLNSGTAMDGLVVHDPLQVSQRFNIRVRDIVGLCKSPTDLVHAVLLEGLSNVAFENIHGYQGFAGVIIKASDGYARGLYGYKNSQVGVYAKSDSYAPCLRMMFDDLQAQDEGLGIGIGVFYSANTFQMGSIVTGKIRTRGFGVGFAINSTAGGQVINDMSFGQILCDTPVNYGMVANSTLLQTSIAQLKVINPVSGRAVQINDECLGLDIGLIEACSPAGKDLDDCIYAGGSFRFGRVANTQQYSNAVTPGITVSYNPAAPSKWSIGSYQARLNVNGTAAGLRNGWTAGALGEPPSATYRNGTVRLAGRIAVPATPWTGKEGCYQVDPAIAPKTARTMSSFAFNGSTGLTYPVLIEVSTAGLVRVSQLNTTATVPAATTWVQLNGLSWDIEG